MSCSCGEQECQGVLYSKNGAMPGKQTGGQNVAADKSNLLLVSSWEQLGKEYYRKHSKNFSSGFYCTSQAVLLWLWAWWLTGRLRSRATLGWSWCCRCSGLSERGPTGGCPSGWVVMRLPVCACCTGERMFCTASVDRQTHDNSVQPVPWSHRRCCATLCASPLWGAFVGGNTHNRIKLSNIGSCRTRTELDFIQKRSSVHELSLCWHISGMRFQQAAHAARLEKQKEPKPWFILYAINTGFCLHIVLAHSNLTRCFYSSWKHRNTEVQDKGYVYTVHIF